MYFGSQQLKKGPYTCAKSGWGYATGNDGWNFTQASTTSALLPGCENVPCTTTNWLCNYWPCGPAASKVWWTGAEIVSPMILQRDNGNLYAPILTFTIDYRNPCAPQNDCINPSGLCWPDNVLNAGTATYVLKSTNGISWSRFTANNGNGEDGRISSVGIDTVTPCYKAAWLINIDMAYDPVGEDWYMTRSYADSYYPPGNNPGAGACYPGNLPNRVQLYRTQGDVGVYYGPWTLLFDGGCANLGYQPDAASIMHDGAGNVVFSAQGRVTLMISSSSGSACGNPSVQAPAHRVLVGP